MLLILYSFFCILYLVTEVLLYLWSDVPPFLPRWFPWFLLLWVFVHYYFLPGEIFGPMMYSWSPYRYVYGDSLGVVVMVRVFSKSEFSAVVLCLKVVMKSHCLLNIGQQWLFTLRYGCNIFHLFVVYGTVRVFVLGLMYVCSYLGPHMLHCFLWVFLNVLKYLRILVCHWHCQYCIPETLI